MALGLLVLPVAVTATIGDRHRGILHSRHHPDSSYFLEEARRLYDAYLAERVILLPVKLDDAPVIDLLSTPQYERAGQLTIAEMVQDLLRRVSEV